jgi:hypothetical protein
MIIQFWDLIIINLVEDESTSLIVPTSSTASMPPRADQRYPVTFPIGSRLLTTAVGLVTLYRFRPNILLQWLSFTPWLEMLRIAFFIPRSQS